jgi:uncharacterized membrane protein YjgN (DUF898 family)
MYGVKCPKCGLMQLPKEKCQSCGKELNGSKGPGHGKLTPAPSSTASPLPQDPVAVQILHAIQKGKMEETRRLSFHGAGGTLFGIYLLNTFLAIFTLGIYSFWGKTKVRSYLWSKTEVERDCFVYHGTGKELMSGFSKAMLVFGIPLTILNMLPNFLEPKEILKIGCMVLTYITVMIFIPVAMVGARRYRLSRTSWRGIRFSFRGKTGDFMKIFLGGGFLTALSLGFYYPFYAVRRQEFMMKNSYFGNRRFEFDGNGRDLFKPYLLALLLTLPTLGLSWFWFLAKKQRYCWGHTHLDAIHFQSTVTGGRLLALHLTNLLLLVVTLGMAWSWVMVRKIRFAFTYLTLEGMMDPAMIRQEAQAASATGDVLAGLMDAGFDLGT